MTSTIASVVIRASAAEVFDLIHDYRRRLEWDPFLRRAELLHLKEFMERGRPRGDDRHG